MTHKKFQGLRIGHKCVIQFWGVLVAKCISKANIRFRYGAVLWFTTARQLWINLSAAYCFHVWCGNMNPWHLIYPTEWGILYILAITSSRCLNKLSNSDQQIQSIKYKYKTEYKYKYKSEYTYPPVAWISWAIWISKVCTNFEIKKYQPMHVAGSIFCFDFLS